MQRQDSLTFINFQENYQTAEIYFCSHMLLHSVKQYLIIVSTSFSQFYSLTLLFLLKLRIFATEIKYAITIMLSMQEGCIMLFTYYSYLFLFCRNEKGLLNFVSERIIFLKPVYRINNTWYSCCEVVTFSFVFQCCYF